MCGRYYVDDETAREIEKIVRNVDLKIKSHKIGDVRPSQAAMVLTGKAEGLFAEEMYWGFPHFDKKGLLINARAETVTERKMFRESVLRRRCIIPAKYFYEWDSDKNKVTFMHKDSSTLYMAGFYGMHQEKAGFVVITTQANDSVCKVHHRMPLVLEEEEVEDWVYDNSFLKYALQKTPLPLEHIQEYSQQRLF